MGNLAKLYTELTSVKKEDKPEESTQSKEEDAAHYQARIMWENSTITKEFLASIDFNLDVLMVEAIRGAITYPTHNNHAKIIQALVRADSLIKIKQQLGLKVESK